jgi:hypothetical protein
MAQKLVPLRNDLCYYSSKRRQDMILALGILAVGVLARFMPHAPNFTPVLALALFGAVHLKRSQAVLLPLVLMMATDLFLGAYPSMPVTWASIILVSFIGLWVRQSQGVSRTLVGSVAGAFAFFVVSNFGVWLTNYPRTLEGFMSCYALAVPFFRGTLASTLLYTVIFFGAYELLASQIKRTRLAPVLLNK